MLYITLIIPVALQDSEAWMMLKSNAKPLGVFKKKKKKKIFSLVRYDDDFPFRTYKELETWTYEAMDVIASSCACPDKKDISAKRVSDAETAEAKMTIISTLEGLNGENYFIVRCYQLKKACLE